MQYSQQKAVVGSKLCGCELHGVEPCMVIVIAELMNDARLYRGQHSPRACQVHEEGTNTLSGSSWIHTFQGGQLLF